jgi:hypothetical protein
VVSVIVEVSSDIVDASVLEACSALFDISPKVLDVGLTVVVDVAIEDSSAVFDVISEVEVCC